MSMQDSKLIFSDAQTINADEYSDNLLDLEEGSVVDQQAGPAWLCMRVVTAGSVTNLAAGLSVTLETRDDVNFASGPGNAPATQKGVVEIPNIPLAELQVDGAVFCVGFLMDDLKRYLKVFYSDEGDSIGGTLNVDTWIQNQPVTKLKTQKLPIA